MEKQPSSAVPASAAREQMRAARQTHDASVRRATTPAGLILATSFFSGALTISAASQGQGQVVMIIALAWFVAELLRLSARDQWRALRTLPRPKWSVSEGVLLGAALFVAAVAGAHLLASRNHSPLASWGLGAAVAALVAAFLFGANASYRRRTSRASQRQR